MRRFVAQAGRRDAREYARGVKAAQSIMRQTKGKTGASSFLIVPVGGGASVPSRVFLLVFLLSLGNTKCSVNNPRFKTSNSENSRTQIP